MRAMTPEHAYAAMLAFLDARYQRLPSNALGQLLGELQLDKDGRPFDLAVIGEWRQAVDSALRQPPSDD